MADPQNPHAGQPVLYRGPSLDSARLVAILIHGRGASAEDILSLADEFDVAVPGTRVIAGNPFLGKNEVNVGGGFRYNLVGDVVLGAYATTPVTDDGYHASWMASASLDVPF